MSRLSTHLPRLSTLAVAMAAAAASYCVHADRSASSGNEGRDQRAAPTADPSKRRPPAASHGTKRRHRGAERRTADAEKAQAEHPATTSRSLFASVRPQSLRVYSAPSRPRKAASRRPRYAVRPRADRDAEHAVDRELQRVIDAPTPAPVPSVPAPPSSAGGSVGQPDVAVPAADVDTTVPVPTIATPVAPTGPSAPEPQPPAATEPAPLQAGTDQVIPHGA
jgi:hypothetical protein